AILLAIATVTALHAFTGAVTDLPPPGVASAPATRRAITQPPDTGTRVTSGQASAPTLIASVFECERHGERVFSDRRCGENARVRAIAAPNRMEAPDPAVLALSMSEPAPAPFAPPYASAAAPEHSRTRCRMLEEEKERIDARMRQGYGATEGEVLRERLRKLD